MVSRRQCLAAALPGPELLQRQSQWLAAARSQALRRVQIAQRQRVLDLGAGYGTVTPELVRRSGGTVVALDLAFCALRFGRALRPSPFEWAITVNATGSALPFRSATFDLVFSQLALLWATPSETVLSEIERVLAPGGSLVAIEPDYGGMIEYPSSIATRELWIAGLRRAGANPCIGRSLPSQLETRGFRVHVALFDTLYPASLQRFEYLRDLPLETAEREALHWIEQRAAQIATPWGQIAHLPFFVITALKPAG